MFYLCFVFIRKLKSPQGKLYVQVVDKSSGSYKVLKSFGGSKDASGIKVLHDKAQEWINKQTGTQELDFSNTDVFVEQFFDSNGFNKIKDDYFRELVLARVAFPKSKLKTKEYRYKLIDWDEDQLYRYLDKLHHTQAEVERIKLVTAKTKSMN